MAIARPNRTIPFPHRAKPRPHRPVIVAGPASGASAFVQEAGSWNFAARIWIAFDGPTATAPAWIPVTGYIETDLPITIGPHGRADGLSDVNATTMSLTADNSDGRWCAANPSGAWYGLIRKGAWIKVEVLPPSGVVSQRFVGFITGLPTGWSGQYASSQITASDRFEKLGNAPSLISCIQSEVLADPNLAGRVKGYWNLHESSGSLTFGDTSGNGAPHLVATAFGGVQVGAGFAAANVNAPGFDNLRTVTFNPPSTSQGTYLTGSITSPVGVWNYATPAYSGSYPTVEFWFQATTTGTAQSLIALVDPVSQSGVTIYIHPSGFLSYIVLSTVVGTTTGAQQGTLTFGSVADGNWHHVVFAGAFSSNGGNFYYTRTSVVDGGTPFASTVSIGASVAAGIPGTYGSAYSQLLVGAGWNFVASAVTFQTGAANISDVAFHWGDMAPGSKIPNLPDHYAAGANGFLGESTDRRVARVARYAGIPVPLQTSSILNPGYGFTTQTYNPSKGGWTNLSPGAHNCGTQSMSGRKPLDVMREAARTEGMPAFTDRSGFLALQPSTVRQNTSPAWTVASVDLEPSTRIADDFAYTTNQMTVTPNGAAAQTVIGASGLASQAKYGIYDGSQATASVSPAEAQSLGLGIIAQRADPTPRLAPIVVEAATLATQPGYGPAWYDAVLASEISTPFRVTALPAQAGGGDADVLIEGWTETIVAASHLFSYSTTPIQGPTYQLDDAILGRLDTGGSTLTAGIGTGTTSFLVTTIAAATGDPEWTTAAADFPFDILVGAEQMTVSGIANTLTADGTFETGTAGWIVTGGNAVSTLAQAHSGTHSCQLTVTGTPTSTTLRTGGFIPVFPNTIYALTQWILAAVGTPNTQATIDWYTAGSVFISTSTSSSVAASGAWTAQTLSNVVSPPTAGQALVGTTLPGSPTTGNAVYVDDVAMTPSITPQMFTVTRAVNGVVSAPLAGTAVNVAAALTLAY